MPRTERASRWGKAALENEERICYDTRRCFWPCCAYPFGSVNEKTAVKADRQTPIKGMGEAAATREEKAARHQARLGEKRMRLFVAIQLSEEMKKALVGIQDELRRRGVQGNYTRPENLHLTLAFIGEYPEPERVLETLEGLCFDPIRLELGGIGSFDQLWWAGLRENEALDTLVRQLRRRLAEADIPFDRKKFMPHITLIRKPRYRGDPRLGTVPVPGVQMGAGCVSLMLSTRGKNGMIYTELGSASGQSGSHRGHT